MKKLWVVLAFVAAVLVVGVLASPAVSACCGGGHSVALLPMGYEVSSISIPNGDYVTWTNKDAAKPHSATEMSMNPLFDSGLLDYGKSFSYTFNTAGTYHVYSTPDSGSSWRMTVIVS